MFGNVFPLTLINVNLRCGFKFDVSCETDSVMQPKGLSVFEKRLVKRPIHAHTHTHGGIHTTHTHTHST